MAYRRHAARARATDLTTRPERALAWRGPPLTSGRSVTGQASGAQVPDSPLPAWRVLDMSQAISGPYAARILSDLGADVLRLESPRTDVTEHFGLITDGRSGMYAQMNAGKRSIAVDLAAPGAVGLVRWLAAAADV